MTRNDFSRAFSMLTKAYGVDMTPMMVESYWHELGGVDLRDFQEAVHRLPSMENRGMPSAATITQYVADAREQRLYDEKHDAAHTLSSLYSVYQTQLPPDADRAYAKICVSYIQWRMEGHGEKHWVPLAKQFIHDHPKWMQEPRHAAEAQHVQEMADGKAGTAQQPNSHFQTLHTGATRRNRTEERTWLYRQCAAPGCLNMSRQEAQSPTSADFGRHYCQNHLEKNYA